jgi:hypothetical protein
MARLYPRLLAAAALVIFAGYFFFYFTHLYATTTYSSAQGILPSMAWTSGEAFVFFVVAVWGFAAICGFVVALVAALAFGHMSRSVEQSVEEGVATKAMHQAA